MLPDLIVIGAGRAGTTSIHRYLGEHPDVFMARDKELMFFVEELNWVHGLDWYEHHFPQAAPVRGESSPQYTLYPRYEGVPARIASVVPDAKLVYIVRDPLERLLSNYARHLAYGHGSRSLEHVLNGPTGRCTLMPAGTGPTRPVSACFPREQILVIDLDDLQHDARVFCVRYSSSSESTPTSRPRPSPQSTTRAHFARAGRPSAGPGRC